MTHGERAAGARTADAGNRLARTVGVPGAVFLGLGSIVGTGIFVSLGTAAGVAGPSVVAAVALAAGVATLNGLSSAQLAASHPVSGGTYEYAYRYVSPAGEECSRSPIWVFTISETRTLEADLLVPPGSVSSETLTRCISTTGLSAPDARRLGDVELNRQWLGRRAQRCQTLRPFDNLSVGHALRVAV